MSPVSFKIDTSNLSSCTSAKCAFGSKQTVCTPKIGLEADSVAGHVSEIRDEQIGKVTVIFSSLSLILQALVY